MLTPTWPGICFVLQVSNTLLWHGMPNSTNTRQFSNTCSGEIQVNNKIRMWHASQISMKVSNELLWFAFLCYFFSKLK